MIDYSMLQEFTTEAGEHLDEMESDLLQLEVDPENRDILNNIFRETHSIKGAAEYVGLEKTAALSHHLENLLDLLRRGNISVTHKIVDLLISARDRMVTLNEDIDRFNAEKIEIKDILKLIRGYSGDDKISEDETEKKSADFHDVDLEEIHFNDTDQEEIIELKDEGSSSDEIYEEDYDVELFEIYLQQLKEIIFFIQDQTVKLFDGENAEVILDDVVKKIERLRSSANYMGYDSLVDIYKNWIDEIRDVQKELSIGESVSFQFMKVFTDKILSRFPEVQDTLSEMTKEPPLAQNKIIEDNQIPKNELIETESTVNTEELDFDEEVQNELDFLDDELKQKDNEETKDGEAEEIDLSDMEFLIDDKKLYDKLENAFDSVTERIADPNPFKIEEELFTPFDDASFEFSLDVSSMESSVENLPKTDINSKEPVESPFFETKTDQAILEKSEMLETETPEVTDQQRDEIPMEETASEMSEATEKVIEQKQKSAFGERLVKQTLRVDAKKIDSLMNQVGELVVSRAWFSQLFNEMQDFQHYLKESMILDKKETKQVRSLTFRLSEATVNLGRVANELQEGIMKVRMLPISHLFNRYPRLVRDLIRDTSKKVELKIKGEDTELDKMIIEQISDPMVHILRNAVDHGIETSDERLGKGKSETGYIILEAYHESNHVVIEIKDDGRGIDPEIIKEKALKNGFVSREELDQMTPKEIISLIMKPGFSTAGKITHTSGRGVGMDVVKKNVEKLNGSLEIDSRPGTETQFRIKIPLTLAIIAALMVRVGKDLFTIPLANVEETIRIFYEDITTIEGIEVIYLRNTTLPLIRLSEIFGISSMEQDHKKAFVVVVSTGMRKAGLVVDSLIGQEEVVIKPLVDYLQENSGFSGATILGDGSISLILDVYELVNLTIGQRLRHLGLGTFQTITARAIGSETSSGEEKIKTATIH